MSKLKRYTHYIINAVDILSFLLSYFISYFLRERVLVRFIPFNPRTDYIGFLMAIVLGYVLYNVTSMYMDDRFLTRNTREELTASVKMVIFVMAVEVLYLFVVQKGFDYSRLFAGVFAAVLVFVDFLMRIMVKKTILPRFQNSGMVEDVLIIAEKNSILEAIQKVANNIDWRYRIAGLVVVDEDLKDTVYMGYPVISDRENMFDDAGNADIDSVLIFAGDEKPSEIRNWISRFRNAGKLVHIEIAEYDLDQSVREVENMGDAAVVTYRVISAMPKRQELFRRVLNIIMSLLCLPLFLFVFIVVFICTNIESPGDVLIPRVRVGKNNRRFYQYRFRVFRTDAEECFRTDKSPYTAIGGFLKATHLDGMPMLLNILNGEMGFVGPKAPNLQRYLSMTSKQRNILCISPGVIGYWSCDEDWQNVQDYEQRYIENWNILKDFAICLTTMYHYLSGTSLRRDGDTHIDEEIQFAKAILEERQPLEYNRTKYTKVLNGSDYIYLFVKRIFDVAASGLGIVILSPVFLILAVLIMADDGGGPIYGHKRIGKNGRKIRVYKFRSMRQDAGDLAKLLTPEQLEQYQREFKIDNDPRITKIGQFIRKTSLDELPQLFNILGGSLSVIGPRPIVEDETKIYGDEIGKLLSVKPGLTGYWQAYARNNATYETGERQAMEMYYVDNQSLWLDIRIFFKTFVSVLKKEGAK